MRRRRAAIGIADRADNCSNTLEMKRALRKPGPVARWLRAGILSIAAYLQVYAPFLHEHDHVVAHAGWHTVPAAQPLALVAALEAPDASDGDRGEDEPRYLDAALSRVAAHDAVATASGTPPSPIDAPLFPNTRSATRTADPPAAALAGIRIAVHRALPPESRGPPTQS